MMYDILLQLPLFQGLSQEQLTLIIEKIPFHFRKFRSNEYLIHEGDECKDIIFILSGRVRMITPTFKTSILIAEDFVAPYTVPFTSFFGSDTTSRCSIYAQGQVGAMVLDKTNFLNLIERNRVMLVNVLNILSANAQKRYLAMDSMAEKDPGVKLARWLLAYTSYLAKNIVVDAEMQDWCAMLNLEEPVLRRAIMQLTEEGCVEAQEGKIKLSDRYGLRTFVSRNTTTN